MKPGETKYVWAPDYGEGFLLGTVADVSGETTSVVLDGTDKVLKAPSEYVFNAEDDLTKDVDDNCGLMYLNEATLLHNLRIRYQDDKIYTYVANILIAVNPYQVIPNLSSKETMMEYKGKSIGLLPPHVFAIADKTYRDMKVFKQSQSINVSGESGSGKTESTKYIIRYLTESYGQGTTSGELEKRIVEANPLLEAFGNAKTIRNLNSSRFGKYVEIHFDGKPRIVGAFISHYLLEKTRICSQSPGERNYHIFYGMCAGTIPELRADLKPMDPNKFNYLNKSAIFDPLINDHDGFKKLDQAMNSVGITPQQKTDIYRIVALVLHLGNIEFQGNQNRGSHINPSSKRVIGDVATLMGLQPGNIGEKFTTRTMVVTTKGREEKSKVALRPDQAAAGRDALAKTIYSKLFDYIVSCVNTCFPFDSSETYIGVLDIAGFEIFEVNRFEQLCINFCNEKLQQFFNENVLKAEQRLYANEGLELTNITFIDNEDCIELFERKITGIMDLLDDEMKFPTPSEQHYTVAVAQRNEAHPRLDVPRKSFSQLDRRLKDDEGFLIRHFAGNVCYQTAGFLSRNNDALADNLQQLLQEATDPFLRILFPPTQSNVSTSSSKKTAFESIGKKFRVQLNLLMKKLSITGANFVRCIKPNELMKDHLFNGGQILRQLQCAGMVSVLHLMHEGYPSRAHFQTLYDRYKSLLPENKVPSDPRMFCKTLFYALGMNKDDFAFGVTKVFFRPGKFAAFDQLMAADPEFLNQLVEMVVKWIIRYRWRRVIWCAVSVQKCANKIKLRQNMLIRIQKTVRMFLEVRRHKPRYEGVMKLKMLDMEVKELTEIVATLRKKQDIYQKKVDEILPLRDEAVKKIRGSILKRTEIFRLHTDLMVKIDFLLDELAAELLVQEEEERLQKLNRTRWKRSIWCSVSVHRLAKKIQNRKENLIRIQKTVRMFLAVRKHKPRYKGLTKIKTLYNDIADLTSLIMSINKKEATNEAEIDKTKLLADAAVKQVQTTIMKEKEMDSLYNDVKAIIGALLKKWRAVKEAELEQERAAQMRRRRRWRKFIFCAVSAVKLSRKILYRREMLICIQKTVRMFLVSRKHRHRWECLMKLKALNIEIEEIKRLIKSLTKRKEGYQQRFNEIMIAIGESTRRIRGKVMSKRGVHRMYESIRERVSNLVVDLYEENDNQREEERKEKLDQLAKLKLSFLQLGTVGNISKKFESLGDRKVSTPDVYRKSSARWGRDVRKDQQTKQEPMRRVSSMF